MTAIRAALDRGVRAAAALGVAAVGLVALAPAAAAHVVVAPDTAVRGTETVFTFRVPDEDPTASTTKVELALPEDHPIASLSVRPTPGWTATLSKAGTSTPLDTDDGPVNEIVTRVVWQADSPADRIAPGEFQEFVVAAGPVPSTKRLVFKVLQFTSDGQVTRWIDPSRRGTDPPHPAPVVTVTGADAPSNFVEGPGSNSGSSGSSGLALAALVGAGVALAVAGLALLAAVRRSEVAVRRSDAAEPASRGRS